jgi:hypothetical protein
MSIRILTRNLLSLLDDAVLTAQAEPGAAGCAGVLLHSARVDEGSEPGGTTCLFATSTNGKVAGHGRTGAEGNLSPTLLPIKYVNALRGSLKKLLTKENRENHITDLRRDGLQLEVAEDDDLFGSGFSQRLDYGDLDDWPRSVFHMLGSAYLTAPKDRKPVENRTDLPVSKLAPLVTIATRHNQDLSLFRVHQATPIHAQIGNFYRAVFSPSAGWNEGSIADGASPEVGVYAPDLPQIKTAEETVRDQVPNLVLV